MNICPVCGIDIDVAKEMFPGGWTLCEEWASPHLGEVKKGKDIGYKNFYRKYIWHACEGCGKKRWVQLTHNSPKKELCPSCAHKRRMVGKQHGPDNFNWKGGEFYKNGYVRIRVPEHPLSDEHGYVKRAVLVLEKKLGRPTLSGMHSHHINGVKDDDRPENLDELSRSEHSKLHRLRGRNTTCEELELTEEEDNERD